MRVIARGVGGVVAIGLLLAALAAASVDAAWTRCGATPPEGAAGQHPAAVHPSWSAESTLSGFDCVYRDDAGREVERLPIGWPPFA